MENNYEDDRNISDDEMAHREAMMLGKLPASNHEKQR
jgi:hypothetical protein